MKTVSLSEAKATLSEQLRHVREGEEVVITHRGRAIARIVPMDVETLPGAAFEGLVAAGLARAGEKPLASDFRDLPHPADPEGCLRILVSQERESGW